MRKSLLLILASIIQTVLFSQTTGSLSGRITDKQNNEPLAGATVSIKGSTTSTVTNNQGYFIFQKQKTGKIILVISFIGYETIEVTADIVNDNTFIGDAALSLDTKVGNEIVVSASKRFEKITDAPASIQVVSRKDIEQFTGSNTFELLSKVQGVEFTRTGVDHASINARGMNNANNNKVFQIVDGRISMNPLSNGLPLHNNSSIIKDDLDKIEIVLGPQTALYGPNAHNAIINFITKDPRRSQGTTVALSAGNQYQFSGRIRQATKIDDKWAYKIAGEYAAGKEFAFYDSVSAGSVTGFPYGPVVSIPEDNINFNFRHIRGEAHIYYSITPDTYIIVSAGGSNNNSINTHTNGRLQYQGLTNSFLQGRFVSPRFYVNIYNAWGNAGTSYQIISYTRDFWNRTHSLITNPNDPRYKNMGRLPPDSARMFALRHPNTIKERPQRLNAEVQYNYKFKKAGLLLVAGFSYQKDKPRTYGIIIVDSFQRIYVTQYGTALQLEKELPWDLRFIGALRWDHHSTMGNFFSPKLGIVKRFGENNVRVVWGKAYSMPSVFYQYASNGLFFGNGEGITYIPNGSNVNDPESRKITTPVKPEEVSTWEIGYKGTIAKKLYIDINYFNGLSKNFFGPSIVVGGRVLYVGKHNAYQLPPTDGIVDPATGILNGARFTTVSNFGTVKVYGIDAGLTYQFNKNVNLTARYSWLGSDITEGNADNDANEDGYVADDEKSLNSPIHRGLAILSFQNLWKQKLFINISARYVEEFDFYSGGQISRKENMGKWDTVIAYPPNRPPIKYPKKFNWGPLGGFTSVDLAAGYKFNEMISVAMNITNLFNTTQREFPGSSSIGRLIMFELKVHVPNKK